jgi:transposase
VVAVGHAILVIAYRLLRDQTDYADVGDPYVDQRERQAVCRRSVRRLEALGFHVHVEDRASRVLPSTV